MPDLSTPFTTEELFRLLARSGLLSDKLLQEQRQRFSDEKLTPAQILTQMLNERLLTTFQAKQLNERRHRGFFLSEKYKILDFLGQGGMSRVLLCEHMLLQRLVAVKILNKSLDKFPGAAERFMREARAAASMDHPNIARVFDVDRTGLGPCIVMEYVDGTNLHDLTTKRHPLSVNRVVHFISEAATGLQQAHLAGLVHRDVKPANLMLDRTGAVKLLDLGLARYFDPERSDNLTREIDASCIIGTADYIAPEQVMESTTADIRSDIYSLGYTMYFLLTRTLPAGTGAGIRKLLWHQTREPEPIEKVRTDVPVELAAVLTKMIQKDPEKRYQTPAEVNAALAKWTKAPIGIPAAEEMPKTMASAYRLGLCPPPDRSKFEDSTSTALPKKSKTSASAATTSTEAVGSSTSVVAEAPVPPSSEIGYSSTQSNQSIETTSSTIRSATTNAVLSSSTETTCATDSSLNRSANFATNIGQPLNRRNALLAIGAALGLVGWTAQWMFPRKSKGLPSPDQLASNSNATWANQTAIEQASYTTPGHGIVLRGGGSTFIRPALERWASVYEKQTGIKIEYSAVGSSKGVDGLISNFVDFACSDTFLTKEQLAEAGPGILHVPLALGAVAVAYNLPGDHSEPPIRLTGALLANIYLGKVKRWNDPAMTVVNPGRVLPDQEIIVVHRSDGSGTTAIWTEYLSQASSAWKSQVGSGAKVVWPVGVAAEKNDGIADVVSRTPGSIGYVELTYALANGLSVGQLKNQSAEFIQPSLNGITAAAATIREIPVDKPISLVDVQATGAYPIVGICWAVLRSDAKNDRSDELFRFVKWTTTEGQNYLASLHYGRLPTGIPNETATALEQLSSRK